MMKNYQLSLPGPSEVDPRVAQAMMRPNLPHYGEVWLDIYRGILQKLGQVYRTAGRVFVLPCSGSGGIDAVLGSLGGRKGLILSNGTFGARLAEIARHHLSRTTVIENPIGQAFRIEQVERALAGERYDFLGVVHGETSSGMVNHMEELAGLCRGRDLLFLVDAVSTLGGVPLDTEGLGIDFCMAASQKALGALPGLATVAVSERGWAALAKEPDIHGWYLNLRTWARYADEWGDWHPYPITLPVHLFFALDKALELLLDEGLEARWARHREVSRALHGRLRSMGIPLLVEDEADRLATVTAAALPEGYVSEDLQKFLRDNHSILIAGGVGPLRKRIFRIGHMGYSAQDWLINRVVAGIKDYLERSAAAGMKEGVADVRG